MKMRDADRLSDEELMTSYQDGDLDAFDALYQRYEKKVYNYLLKRTGNVEISQDLFQDIFLNLHRSRHDYDPNRPFATWLFTIASNVVKNEFKRLSRLRKKMDPSVQDLDALGAGRNGNPELEFRRREKSREVSGLLWCLPESQREVIVLNKYFGFSYAEIAEITGSSMAAVKQKAHRGFLQLRDVLEHNPTSWTGEEAI